MAESQHLRQGRMCIKTNHWGDSNITWMKNVVVLIKMDFFTHKRGWLQFRSVIHKGNHITIETKVQFSEGAHKLSFGRLKMLKRVILNVLKSFIPITFVSYCSFVAWEVWTAWLLYLCPWGIFRLILKSFLCLKPQRAHSDNKLSNKSHDSWANRRTPLSFSLLWTC